MLLDKKEENPLQEEEEYAAAVLARIIVLLAPQFDEFTVFSIVRDFVEDGRFGLEGAEDLSRMIQAEVYNPKTDTLH